MVSSVPFGTLSTHVAALVVQIEIIQLTAGAEVVLGVRQGARALFAVLCGSPQRVAVETCCASFAFFTDGVVFAETFSWKILVLNGLAKPHISSTN